MESRAYTKRRAQNKNTQSAHIFLRLEGNLRKLGSFYSIITA
jgi:hypothetical protein